MNHCATKANIYICGLRIGGFDGNTLYNGNNNIGLTVNNGYSINFYSCGGNGNIMSIINNNIHAYQTLLAPTIVSFRWKFWVKISNRYYF